MSMPGSLRQSVRSFSEPHYIPRDMLRRIPALLQDIGKGNAVQIFIDHFFQPRPHKQSGTFGAAGAAVWGLVETGDRGEAALGEAENFPNRIFFGTAGKTIAALHFAIGLQELGPIEQQNDLFQVLFRNSLPFGNIFERNIALISIDLTLGPGQAASAARSGPSWKFSYGDLPSVKILPTVNTFSQSPHNGRHGG